MVDADVSGGGAILVIGNGPSASRAELGAQIDRFPVVGRINNYATEGFETRVGRCTDIWFNGANQGLMRRRQPPPRIVVLIPSAVQRHKGAALRPRVRRRLGVAEGGYELVALGEIESYEGTLGVDRVTTGTMALLWALRRFDEVHIHGFDFFQGSRAHYHDSRVKRWWVDAVHSRRGRRHDNEAERRHVAGLRDAGRISLLERPRG